VTLALGLRAVIAEDRFDAVGGVGCPVSIDVDDQRRAFAVTVIDNDREFIGSVRVR